MGARWITPQRFEPISCGRLGRLRVTRRAGAPAATQRRSLSACDSEQAVSRISYTRCGIGSTRIRLPRGAFVEVKSPDGLSSIVGLHSSGHRGHNVAEQRIKDRSESLKVLSNHAIQPLDPQPARPPRQLIHGSIAEVLRTPRTPERFWHFPLKPLVRE
jgi:hypothetical protein